MELLARSPPPPPPHSARACRSMSPALMLLLVKFCMYCHSQFLVRPLVSTARTFTPQSGMHIQFDVVIDYKQQGSHVSLTFLVASICCHIFMQIVWQPTICVMAICQPLLQVARFGKNLYLWHVRYGAVMVVCYKLGKDPNTGLRKSNMPNSCVANCGKQLNTVLQQKLVCHGILTELYIKRVYCETTYCMSYLSNDMKAM